MNEVRQNSPTLTIKIDQYTVAQIKIRREWFLIRCLLSPNRQSQTINADLDIIDDDRIVVKFSPTKKLKVWNHEQHDYLGV